MAVERKEAMSHNVSHVCDVAPSLTEARGHVAERRAVAPRSPRRLPRRRCAYALLCAVVVIGIDRILIIRVSIMFLRSK